LKIILVIESPGNYIVVLEISRLWYTHLVTHLVWPHRPENSPGRPRAQRISPWRSPSLF